MLVRHVLVLNLPIIWFFFAGNSAPLFSCINFPIWCKYQVSNQHYLLLIFLMRLFDFKYLTTGPVDTNVNLLEVAPDLWGEWVRIFHAATSSHVHADVIKWNHFPRYWPFVRGVHRSPVNTPHKGQWRRAVMFSLICVWINDWVNNPEAGDLRRYRAHYDVIAMPTSTHLINENGI